MSNNKNQRGRGGNQQQQRRRRGRPGQPQQQQPPKGPAMTALGESTYEAVFDHGNEGYGVWFDGVVREDPNYKQFWKGTGMRPIFVRIDEDRIVITKELDRELPNLGGGEPGNTRGEDENDNENESSDSGNVDDMVYSAEEAARLFAAEGMDAEAPDNGATVAEPEAAAEPDADDDADEPEEKPAPKRRTTRRRTTKPADDGGE